MSVSPPDASGPLGDARQDLGDAELTQLPVLREHIRVHVIEL
jgi:hypothetical protein